MIVAVVGPTAGSKSTLALDLAQSLDIPQFRTRFPDGVEVVNADAFGLYRGMDIGTAKLPLAERRGIAHHQLDQLWPDEDASVAAYQRHARADVEAILARGALPLVVGGSGLYVRALLDRLEFPPTDPEVRLRWQERLDVEGAPALHALLRERDPAAAQAINPENGRRLVRALEAIEITGKPFSATLPDGTYYYPDTLQFYLTRPLAVLDERIAQRSSKMFAAGLLTETQALLSDRVHPWGVTAQKATGYAQAKAVLEGEMTLEEAIDATAQATRQLARRQIKWFRRDERAVKIEISSGEEVRMFLDQARHQILGD